MVTSLMLFLLGLPVFLPPACGSQQAAADVDQFVDVQPQQATADVDQFVDVQPQQATADVDQFVDVQPQQATADVVQGEDVQPQQATADVVQRVGVQPQKPCSCTEGECNCCAVVKLDKVKFMGKGCIRFRYDIFRKGINMQALLNNIPLFKTEVSARNAPPVCVPLPVQIVTICVRIREIRWQDQKLVVCANIEVHLGPFPLIVIPFDCVHIGADGIGVFNPTTVPSTSISTITTV